jgi:hypothetical protein
MTVEEAGRLGGQKRKAEGCDYQSLGEKGGSTTRERYGRSFYAKLGQKSGEVRRKKQHGGD